MYLSIRLPMYLAYLPTYLPPYLPDLPMSVCVHIHMYVLY